LLRIATLPFSLVKCYIVTLDHVGNRFWFRTMLVATSRITVAPMLPTHGLVPGEHRSLVAGDQLLDYLKAGAQPGRVAAFLELVPSPR
jgi:hypothetical protein